jgi:hypothetical protein
VHRQGLTAELAGIPVIGEEFLPTAFVIVLELALRATGGRFKTSRHFDQQLDSAKPVDEFEDVGALFRQDANTHGFIFQPEGGVPAVLAFDQHGSLHF